MPTFICDPELEAQLRAERALTGADRFDEVWEGIYVMAPLADNEHQQIVSQLTAIFQQCVGWIQSGIVFPGVNVSDRVDDWKSNFRCPDVAVFLAGTAAVNHNAFWCGGPDFVVEVSSEGDRSLEKIPFYAQVGTREVLIVHRRPWKLALYRLSDSTLTPVGCSELPEGVLLQSEVVDFSFRLVDGHSRPMIHVVHRPSKNEWNV